MAENINVGHHYKSLNTTDIEAGESVYDEFDATNLATTANVGQHAGKNVLESLKDSTAFALLSEDWATSSELVEEEDYSAKYWAFFTKDLVEGVLSGGVSTGGLGAPLTEGLPNGFFQTGSEVERAAILKQKEVSIEYDIRALRLGYIIPLRSTNFQNDMYKSSARTNPKLDILFTNAKAATAAMKVIGEMLTLHEIENYNPINDPDWAR
jgi:hypothetical protein